MIKTVSCAIAVWFLLCYHMHIVWFLLRYQWLMVSMINITCLATDIALDINDLLYHTNHSPLILGFSCYLSWYHGTCTQATGWRRLRRQCGLSLASPSDANLTYWGSDSLKSCNPPWSWLHSSCQLFQGRWSSLGLDHSDLQSLALRPGRAAGLT